MVARDGIEQYSLRRARPSNVAYFLVRTSRNHFIVLPSLFCLPVFQCKCRPLRRDPVHALVYVGAPLPGRRTHSRNLPPPPAPRPNILTFRENLGEMHVTSPGFRGLPHLPVQNVTPSTALPAGGA